MRDRRLERVEAIIERQQRMPAEGDDERRLFLGTVERASFGIAKQMADTRTFGRGLKPGPDHLRQARRDQETAAGKWRLAGGAENRLKERKGVYFSAAKTARLAA